MITITNSATIVLNADEASCLLEAGKVIKDFCQQVENLDSPITTIHLSSANIGTDALDACGLECVLTPYLV